MSKRAKTLWADSKSQPRPINNSPLAAHDGARLRLFLARGAMIVAAFAVIAFVLNAFWLRAGPTLLRWRLGPEGTTEESGTV